MLWLCFDLWFFLCSAMLSSVTKMCLTLCELMDCNQPGSSVHGVSQARILEWVAISSSRGSFRSKDQTCISCIGRWVLNQGGFFTTEPPGEPWFFLVPLKMMQNTITFFKILVMSTSYVPNVWFTWNILYKVNFGENKYSN